MELTGLRAAIKKIQRNEATFFPENTIQIFKNYHITSHRVGAILEGFEVTAHKFVSDSTASKRLQKARKKLHDRLLPLAEGLADSVINETNDIINKILNRKADEVEALINALVSADLNGLVPDDEKWDEALRRDDVKGKADDFLFDDEVILRGFKGDDVTPIEREQIHDIIEFLREGSDERRFRQGLLNAERLADSGGFKRPSTSTSV